MIELYFDTEEPLPLDVAALCRKVVARTEEEKSAVLALLDEFFIQAEDGWRNERCDEDIAAAAIKMGDAEDRRENERERQRRHRERRKLLFAQLREFGDVPDFDMATEQLQLRLNTHTSRVTPELRTEDATANQYTEPNEHKPREEKQDSAEQEYGAEKKSTEPEYPPAYTLPLNTGDEFPIANQRVAEFGVLYPAVDVMQELRKMRGWLVTNPAKRKTKTGIMKFVNAWLSKQQDLGGTGVPQSTRQALAAKPSPYQVAHIDHSETDRLMAEDMARRGTVMPADGNLEF